MRNWTPTWSLFIRAPTRFSTPSPCGLVSVSQTYKKHPKPLVHPQDSKLHYAHNGSSVLANHESCQIQVNQPEYPPVTGYYVCPHPSLPRTVPIFASPNDNVSMRIPWWRTPRENVEPSSSTGGNGVYLSTLHPIFQLRSLTMKHSCALYLVSYIRVLLIGLGPMHRFPRIDPRIVLLDIPSSLYGRRDLWVLDGQ